MVKPLESDNSENLNLLIISSESELFINTFEVPGNQISIFVHLY